MATIKQWMDEIETLNTEERKNLLSAFKLILDWEYFAHGFAGQGIDLIYQMLRIRQAEYEGKLDGPAKGDPS